MSADLLASLWRLAAQHVTQLGQGMMQNGIVIQLLCHPHSFVQGQHSVLEADTNISKQSKASLYRILVTAISWHIDLTVSMTSDMSYVQDRDERCRGSQPSPCEIRECSISLISS